jgi:hypothetical protein
VRAKTKANTNNKLNLLNFQSYNALKYHIKIYNKSPPSLSMPSNMNMYTKQHTKYSFYPSMPSNTIMQIGQQV